FLAKKKWARNIFQKKILFMAFGLWFVAMFPMIIHDLSHGFPQTLKFLAWVGYRVLVFFGYPPINPITPVSLQEMIGVVAESYERLIFASNGFVSLVLFGISFFVLLSHILKKKNIGAFVLLGIVNFFLLAGLFVVKAPSAAYFPLLFPGL